MLTGEIALLCSHCFHVVKPHALLLVPALNTVLVAVLKGSVHVVCMGQRPRPPAESRYPDPPADWALLPEFVCDNLCLLYIAVITRYITLL